MDECALAQRLIKYDTSTPEGLVAAAGFVRGWLESREIEVLTRVHNGMPVLTADVGPADAPAVVFHGHLDVVPGRPEQFEPLIDGDRLYGRGAYDMKAGLAAALVAAREASRRGLAGEVVVAAVADEEHASLGVQEVLEHVRPDAAIVTEPTELAVATSHRGFVWTEIEVVGVAAHGSRPHLGKDAILKTGPILLALSDLNQRLRDRTHPRLGRGFVHGGLIHGGREASTIPDRCTLTIERRTLPGETVQDVERDIDELLATCRTADPELEASSRTTLARPPFEIDDEDAFVHTVAGAVSAALGRPADLAGVSYWADASLIADAGIPTVLFGPPGDGAHADVEWVSVSGTVDCTRALVSAAGAFCGGART